jgi:hypothetical protein
MPPNTRISVEIPGSYFHDCYAMPVAHEGRSALAIFLATVARSPRWVETLMALRNRVVALFGLKDLGHLGSLPPFKDAAAYRIGERVGIFTLLDDEVTTVLMAASSETWTNKPVCPTARSPARTWLSG